PFARRTLAPFGPLLWLLAWADRGLHTLVHTPRPLQPDLGIAQRDMLLGVFTLADTTVDEVMTPRLDMQSVDIGSSTEEVLDAFRQSQHTRLPVLDGSPDNVGGVVFGKDLVPIAMGLVEPGMRWQTLVRPAAFVPETKTLDSRVSLDELSAALGTTFAHAEVSTVGGLVYSVLGRVPRPGDELTLDGYRVVVERVEQRRVTQVSFEKR